MTTSTDNAEIDLQPLKESLPATPDVPGEARREIIVRRLSEFHVAKDVANDPNTLLGKRYLCRGGAMLLCGPTGIGKSSLLLQAAISFGLARPLFGVAPSRNLKSLLIQGENDDGDVTEMRDGAYRGMNLSEQEQIDAGGAVQVVCESIATGSDFIALAGELVAAHKPDMLLIDPLFAFCGCNVSDQERMSAFLRNGLNPILQGSGCGAIVAHHTNKPSVGREKPDWRAGDFAYLGSGSAELANWARAVVGIRSVGSHSVFEIVLGKRGRRAGLVDDEGKPKYSFYIKHSAVGICWETATEDDLPDNDDGRHTVTIKDVEACFGDDCILQYSKLVEALVENHGVGERTAKSAVARAKVQGVIRKTPSGVYELTKPKGAR
jgi:hypothetical protein